MTDQTPRRRIKWDREQRPDIDYGDSSMRSLAFALMACAVLVAGIIALIF